MASRTRKNVGVLGLGIIGQRVVSSLRERGFHVFVWNRTPRPVPNFVGSPAEVAELCDYVQIFVSDDDALLQMMQRMTPNLTAQHIVMAHCTVSPDTMRAAAEMAERRGAQLLDCPFTGSKNAAENGELVYYVGGDDNALRLARPILEASSKEIIEIGKVGDATTIKVATNMITAASVQAAAEALALVSKSGLAPEKFAAAMKNNGSNSATLEMKLPMMMEGNFEPHFSVKHMLKDVVIATRLARNFGIEFGATDASRHGLTEEMRQGRGDADYSSLFRQYLPAGGAAGAASNGDQDQPSFAGLDEAKPVEPEKVPVAVETTAEVPSEAKSMGEVVPAPAAPETEPAAEVPESTPAVTEPAPAVTEPTPAITQPATAATEPAPATETEVPAGTTAATAAVPVGAGINAPVVDDETKIKQEPALSFPSPPKEDEGEEPRGLWGGFWRRRED
ncbi:MAG TPA: NAD(P)-binding domain-containing protein [Chthoniobacterales bacterium]|jgi:3-hydroxyisobutyrate dehydrogenase-like beta-hydroxyacid dehydrogenase|nr:NAD(P)-binding domain-containing protein [Chthoniobacterales bacterium]